MESHGMIRRIATVAAPEGLLRSDVALPAERALLSTFPAFILILATPI